MNLEHLVSFLAVTEHMSFRKAAETLFAGQSSISRHVASLEDELGTQLLIRDNRNVALTKAGELLMTRGKMIMADINKLENEIRLTDKEERTGISIVSLPHCFKPYFEILMEFTAKHPEVNINHSAFPAQAVRDRVAQGEADIGVTFSFEIFSDDVVFDRLTIELEHSGVILPKGHRLALRENLRYEDLADETILFCNGHAFRDREVPEFLKNCEVFCMCSPKPEWDYPLPVRVRAGEGIAVMPGPRARAICHESGLVCRDITDDEDLFGIDIFWRRDNKNKMLSAFLDCARNVCAVSGK